MIDAMRDVGHRLFVAPRTAWPLAIARVVIGSSILLWALTMILDADALLGDEALVGAEFADGLNRYLPLDSTLTVGVALAVLVVAAIAIVVGWRPSVWLIVAFVLLVAIQRRNTMILNSGDIILRDLTLLLALTPTGAAMSVDRVRRHGRDAFWTSAMVAPWGLRLVQLQMMVVYLFAFWSKSGSQWHDGTAVSTAFRLRDLQRFGELNVLVDNIWVVAALTWSTLAVELALGTLLWVKRLRPVLIVCGVLLHVMIDTFMLVGFFGLAMIAGLMTFLDSDRVGRFIRRRMSRFGSDPNLDVGGPGQAVGSRKPTSAPPVGDSPAQTSPPCTSAT